MGIFGIGPLYLIADKVPPSYSPFEIESLPPGHEEDIVRLFFGRKRPDLNQARKIAEHIQMNVWEVTGKEGERTGWLFEDTLGRCFLEVSTDYSRGDFYCEKDSMEKELLILPPLLEAMLECRLIRSGVMILHAACVETGEGAIAFSAPSGTGKSTRAGNFVNHLGARWISGDRPAVDPKDKVVYGVPWDGKEQVFVNKKVPVRAVLEVRRSHSSLLSTLTNMQACRFLAGQLFIPMWDTALAAQAFRGLEMMTENLPVMRLFCDWTPEAAARIEALLVQALQRQDCVPGPRVAPVDIDASNFKSEDGEKGIITSNKKEETKEMKLKDGFELTELGGDFMLIPTGNNIVEFGGSVVLNDVSAFLLDKMKAPVTRDELLELVLAEYEVEKDRAAEDLDKILKTFSEMGILE